MSPIMTGMVTHNPIQTKVDDSKCICVRRSPCTHKVGYNCGRETLSLGNVTERTSSNSLDLISIFHQGL